MAGLKKNQGPKKSQLADVKSESDSDMDTKVEIKSESDLSDDDDEIKDDDDDLELEDDEFDVGDDDEDDEKDGIHPKKRTAQESFANAMDAIFGSKIKAHDRDNPVLIRARKKAKLMTDAKLEYNAKKALAAEKKEFLEKGHERDILPTGSDARVVLEKERTLRKTAQRGVVQLFNAIMKAQGQAASVSSAPKGSMGGTADRVKEKVGEMTKDTFLDAIRSG